MEVLEFVQLTLFAVLGLASLREWSRHREPQAVWAVATFGSLAVVALAGRVIPEGQPGAWLVAGRALIVLLLLFPYALYRFAYSFEEDGHRFGVPELATIAVAVYSAVLPRYPLPGEPRPLWFVVFLVAFLGLWTVLSVSAGMRLWRSGSGQPVVARARMRMLAAGAIGLSLLLLYSGANPAPTSTSQAITTSAGIVSAALFFLGLSPPAFVRRRWRRADRRALDTAIADLVAAMDSHAVAAQLLPNASRLMSAGWVALLDVDGQVVGEHGLRPPDGERRRQEFRLHLRHGELVLTVSPYTPFFGREEMEELESLGHLADLALERCGAVEREREFIANAAHELRTPLTAMLGLTSTVAEHRARMTEEQLESSLQGAVRQGDRARTLINNLLDMARLERGGGQFKADPDHPVVVARCIESALDEAPPGAEHHVEVEAPSDLAVVADASRLQQVIVNLLTNAYRYGGPNISIRVAGIGSSVQITVSDDGPGVSAELVPRLFRPFSRDREASRVGSGLGLAICKRIVEGAGGSIVYSPDESGGARFDVRLRRSLDTSPGEQRRAE